jgi:DNA-binding NarL/FixJ family response regulator
MNSDNCKQKQILIHHAKLTKRKSGEAQKSHWRVQKNWNYYIEERRREVAQMLAQGYSETEITQLLQVHVSTISRDVRNVKAIVTAV